MLLSTTNAAGTTFTFGADYVDPDGNAIAPAVLANGESRNYVWYSPDGSSLVTVSGLPTASGDNFCFLPI